MSPAAKGGGPLNTKRVLEIAAKQLCGTKGDTFNLLTLSKPQSAAAAVNLAKVISKLSPLLGNLIEFSTVELLNQVKELRAGGRWVRQDPGFPDTIFEGSVKPTPGFEVKAWFPLATEITARFKDSQNHFAQDNICVAMLAWLPEKLIFGRPMVLDVCIVSAASVAAARDEHYHDPPDYLVLEPENTTSRTKNLQQTNTNGYKWQGTESDFKAAHELVRHWGPGGTKYQPTAEYQARLRELLARYKYRLDTNYAKMDRIEHTEIEAFKQRVASMKVQGMSVGEWADLFASGDDQRVLRTLQKHLAIETDAAGK